MLLQHQASIVDLFQPVGQKSPTSYAERALNFRITEAETHNLYLYMCMTMYKYFSNILFVVDHLTDVEISGIMPKAVYTDGHVCGHGD